MKCKLCSTVWYFVCLGLFVLVVSGCESPEQKELKSLIKQLQNEDLSVRFQASQALRNMEELPTEAVPALTKTLKDEDESVQEEAYHALREGIYVLISALSDKDKSIRRDVARALIFIPDVKTQVETPTEDVKTGLSLLESIIAALAQSLESETNKTVRIAMIEAMGATTGKINNLKQSLITQKIEKLDTGIEVYDTISKHPRASRQKRGNRCHRAGNGRLLFRQNLNGSTQESKSEISRHSLLLDSHWFDIRPSVLVGSQFGMVWHHEMLESLNRD